MRVDELIRTSPITVGAAEPLVGCARRMTDHAIRHLPVLGPGGEVLGVATDDGVFGGGALVDEGRGWVWFDGADPSWTARDVAVPADVIALPGDDLGATLRRLAKSARDFVVVVEEGRLVGVVTEHDLLRLAIDHLPAGAVLEPSAPVASVGTRTPADAALEIQRKLGFRHLVVEDEDGRAVGVVSRRDLLTAWPRDLAVGDLQSGGALVAVSAGWPSGPALTAMRDLKLGAVPVLNEHGRAVGILTRRDVLRQVITSLEDDALFG